MPTNWDAVNAQCPFYLTETINTITCEGIIGQTDVHGFHLRAVKAEHKNKFATAVSSDANITSHWLMKNIPKKNLQRKKDEKSTVREMWQRVLLCDNSEMQI